MAQNVPGRHRAPGRFNALVRAKTIAKESAQPAVKGAAIVAASGGLVAVVRRHGERRRRHEQRRSDPPPLHAPAGRPARLSGNALSVDRLRRKPALKSRGQAARHRGHQGQDPARRKAAQKAAAERASRREAAQRRRSGPGCRRAGRRRRVSHHAARLAFHLGRTRPRSTHGRRRRRPLRPGPERLRHRRHRAVALRHPLRLRRHDARRLRLLGLHVLRLPPGRHLHPAHGVRPAGCGHPVSSPRPGDLVFFGYPAYHVGIYVSPGR